MDSYQHERVETFVTVTGASEAEARKKLQDFRGDINAAIDSYLSEREASVVPVHIEGGRSYFMPEDVPSPMDRIATQPFGPMPFGPAWARRLPNAGGFGLEGMIASRFPRRGTSPVVNQPRDLREIPIDWKDEEPKSRSNADIIIEEIPATDETWPSSQVQPHVVCDDEDTPGPSPTTSVYGPQVRDVKDGTPTSDDRDVEEEMLKAALEASQKQMTDMGILETLRGIRMDENGLDGEDDDFVRAVSQSLKTAEQEQALREGKGFSQSTEFLKDQHVEVEEERLKAAVEASQEFMGMGPAEEQGIQKSFKQSALHEEPDLKNENAVTIMLRLPDGTRQGRRFLKSEPLQCLFDFIDATCGLRPDSYRLVRPYPTRVLADTECASSFQELGLTSKYETLILEVN